MDWSWLKKNLKIYKTLNSEKKGTIWKKIGVMSMRHVQSGDDFSVLHKNGHCLKIIMKEILLTMLN